MTAAIALPRQPYSDWLARLRTIGLGLGGRGVMGLGLGRTSASAAAPWWLAGGAPAPVAVYQPKGAASLAASYVNLANPGTYDAAPGTAPTFDAATGWTFNGSTQYLDSGQEVTSTTTAICRFSNAGGSSSRAVFGINRGATGQRFYIRVRENNDRRYAWGSSTALVGSGALTSGVVALAGPNGYLNGQADVTVSATWTNVLVTLLIGCERSATGQQSHFQGDILAFVTYGNILSSAEISSVSAAMAAL